MNKKLKITTLPEEPTTTIFYGFHPTTFGECLVAISDRGICHVSFNQEREQAVIDLKYDWPDARFEQDASKTQEIVDHLFATKKPSKPFHANLHLKGTPFQLQVWDALLNIQRGTTTSYESIAQALGKPKATRAVASAIAQNNIAVIIPCHRVISKDGSVHKYRWGSDVKKALIEWEAKSE